MIGLKKQVHDNIYFSWLLICFCAGVVYSYHYCQCHELYQDAPATTEPCLKVNCKNVSAYTGQVPGCQRPLALTDIEGVDKLEV